MPGNISIKNSGYYSIKKHIYKAKSSNKFSRRVSIAKKGNKLFVIKYFRLSRSLDKKEKILKSFNEEINALKLLNHSGIVKLISYSDNGALHKNHREIIPISFFIMEYNSGISLFDYIDSGSFKEPLARFYFKQLILIVKYIHNSNFVHRDIKLENILLDRFYELKLIDFGLSSEINNTKQVSGERGTHGYQAPEIFRNHYFLGFPTDIFAMGVTLLNIITGVSLFALENSKKNINENEFYKLFIGNNSDFWRYVHKRLGINPSPELKDLLDRLLESNPDSRITLEQIFHHHWINSIDTPCYQEVVYELDKRRQIVKSNLKKNKRTSKLIDEQIFGIETFNGVQDRISIQFLERQLKQKA